MVGQHSVLASAASARTELAGREIEQFRRANTDPLIVAPSVLQLEHWVGYLYYQVFALLTPDLDAALHVRLASEQTGAATADERKTLRHMQACRLSYAGFLARWMHRLALRKPEHVSLFELAACSIHMRRHIDPPRKRSVSFELNVHAFYRNERHRIPARLHHLCNGLRQSSFALFAKRFARQVAAERIELTQHRSTVKLEAHLERFLHMTTTEEAVLVALREWIARWPPVAPDQLDEDRGRRLDQLPLIHPFTTLFQQLQSYHHALEHVLLESGGGGGDASTTRPGQPDTTPPAAAVVAMDIG